MHVDLVQPIWEGHMALQERARVPTRTEIFLSFLLEMSQRAFFNCPQKPVRRGQKMPLKNSAQAYPQGRALACLQESGQIVYYREEIVVYFTQKEIVQ